MTSAWLLDDLRCDEGCRLTAYPDPLTGAAPWTIGYGCTGEGVGPETVWTQAQADDALADRVDAATAALTKALPWFNGLDPLRQDVLVNMAYNMGVSGLLAFQHTLHAVEQGEYALAAQGMLASRWAAQVPKRADRLAQQMLTGVRA